MKFNKLLKFVSSLALSVVMILSLATPAFAASAGTNSTTTLNLMAAASMHYSLGDRGGDGAYPSGTLLKAFEDQNANIKVNVTYDSSGNLLNQMIADPTSSADVFISADLARMNSAVTAGIIDVNTKYNLLNNKLVLVGNKTTGPGSLTYAGVLAWLQGGTSRTIAIGNPTVVPAGTYTQQVFNTIDPTGATWNSIITYAHQYSDVTTVLKNVVTGVDPIGSVYATDAKQSPTLNVLDTKDVSIIYPIGITNAAMGDGVREPAAQALVDFLKADIVKIDGSSVFRSFGFSAAQ